MSEAIQKMNMINILIKDFEKMYPDADTATKRNLQMHLMGLERADLALLLSQLDVNTLPEPKK